MRIFSKILSILLPIFFVGFFIESKDLIDSKISSEFGNMKVGFDGKFITQGSFIRNVKFFNNEEIADRSSGVLADVDARFVAKYAQEKQTKMEGELGIRAKIAAGSKTAVSSSESTASIGGVDIAVPGQPVQKHVPWVKAANMKIALTDSQPIDDYFVRIGIFPYNIARGISLGSSYKAGSLMAFGARFFVDQPAPGILVHSKTFSDKVTMDGYFALLDNAGASFSDNNEKIRTNDLSADVGSSKIRGIGRNKWAAALNMHCKLADSDDMKIDVNPYCIYYHAPDQKVEFAADADSYIWTLGMSLEQESGRFSYGFETAFNFGQSRIKPWDRNVISLVRDADGYSAYQYTKVYQESALTNLAYVSDTNKTHVDDSSIKSFDQNSKQIGTSGLWNAPDRFRPEQKKLYEGFFFVADCAYELIKDQLTCVLDTGYFSGDLDRYDDVNSMSEQQRMNQKYAGFIPLQRIYAGKRLNHIMMLNEGVARLTVEEPKKDIKDLYVPAKVTADLLSNLAYVGGAMNWKPEFARDYSLTLKPTIVHYWSAVAPLLETGKRSSASLGTTFSLEAELKTWEALIFNCYVGLMFPGMQYEQFKGTKLKDGTLGNDMAYAVNVSMCYRF